MNDEYAARDPHKLLSKSFLTGLDWCQRESWFDMWQRRPWIPKEAVAFGSAVDEGLQVVIKAMASGQAPDMDRALEAAAASMNEAGIAVDASGVQQAIEAFPALDIDWSYALVQHTIDIEVDELGKVNCHPDIILGDGSVLDIKTSKKSKPRWAAAQSYKELAFYGYLREQETGVPVPRVGYLTWVRSSRPGWQVLMADLTAEMKHKAFVIARDEVRKLAIDARINEGRDEPINAIYTQGPAWPGKCADCAYSPAFGGPCEIAEEERKTA